MKKSVFLFSQSPSDIKYVLYLYKKYKKKHNDITIIVVNIKNNFIFYNSLNLDVKIIFIPFISIKNPIKAFFYSFKLKFLYYKLIADKANIVSYFFSDNSDYITSFFINKLQKSKQKVLFVDIFNISGIELNLFKFKCIQLITKILFDINIIFFHINERISYKFINHTKRISLNFNIDVLSEFFLKINTLNNSKKNLLLFESEEPSNMFKNYERNLLDFIQKYSKEYNIFIKPHPRMGYSKFLDVYAAGIIENHIPAEFLNLKSFDLVVSIISVAISTIKHDNKMCIIKLFDLIIEEEEEYYIEYLKRQNNGEEIIFLERDRSFIDKSRL